MKEYIKPSINNLDVESSVMMAGSLDALGTTGNLGENAGQADAGTARSKRHNESLWDLSWDDLEEEENN
ncbi:hypothetical protein [Prevotella sp.]|uniref:hypothetical protein n=1 Tax=Prevotella sp. TaxID=59823 RepID=UPI0030770556